MNTSSRQSPLRQIMLYIVSFMTFFVGLSMAEIVSAIPTSGGPYFWAAMLAPEKHAAFLSWITGWFNFVGQVKLETPEFVHINLPTPAAVCCHDRYQLRMRRLDHNRSDDQDFLPGHGCTDPRDLRRDPGESWPSEYLWSPCSTIPQQYVHRPA